MTIRVPARLRDPLVAVLLGSLIPLLTLAAVSPPSRAHLDPPTPRSQTWHTSGYRIEVDTVVTTYAIAPETPLPLDDPDRIVDADGALQVSWPDHDEPVLHPVSTAMYGLYAYESWQVTDDPEYWRRAVANAQALLDGAVEIDGALWFPYAFDYALHGDTNMTLRAPWYSGMAQGQALSLISRIYAETGQDRWRVAAEQILASYAVNGPRDAPWFAHALEEHLWLEEYPDTFGAVPDTGVINGHIYSAWGLYDYYVRVEADPAVAALFDAAATTIREQYGRYRRPDRISLYCAQRYCSDVTWAPANYHRGVANQVDLLAEMTGDARFDEMALTLRLDYVASGATG